MQFHTLLLSITHTNQLQHCPDYSRHVPSVTLKTSPPTTNVKPSNFSPPAIGAAPAGVADMAAGSCRKTSSTALTSSAPLTAGLKGGSTCSAKSLSQLISANQGI